LYIFRVLGLRPSALCFNIHYLSKKKKNLTHNHTEDNTRNKDFSGISEQTMQEGHIHSQQKDSRQYSCELLCRLQVAQYLLD
jgi:hypothetical protein